MVQGKTIKVLVVDDSFFMRKLIADILNADPEIEVIGTANNGKEAIEQAEKLKPNVIVMDLKMPVMDGKEATQRILNWPEPCPVILMLSAYVKEGSEEFSECLESGAITCILKPSGPLSLDIEKVEKELVAQVKIAGGISKEKLRKFKEIRKDKDKRLRKPVDLNPEKIVVIGGSTGAPPVLEEILLGIPSNFGAAILVVQHMPATFTASLAERLDKTVALKVREAKEKDIVKSGLVFIAPGDQHMEIEEAEAEQGVMAVIHLTRAPFRHGLRPSIDVLMESVAKVFAGDVIGVFLTGMGKDGVEGARAIKGNGGRIIVQDPKTCVIDSVVRAVIDEGLADEVLAPEKIAGRLFELVGGGGAYKKLKS